MSSGKANTIAEFSQLLEVQTETLGLVVKAHYSIEAKIQDALEFVLPRADALELRRVAFLLKVDFLVALGVLHPKFRPLFEQVNAVRNRFAHNPYAEWTADDSSRARNGIKAIDPRYPCDSGYGGDALNVLMHVIYDYVARKHKGLELDKLRAEILEEMSNDPAWHEQIVPGYSELPPVPNEMLREVEAQTREELERRVKQKLV